MILFLFFKTDRLRRTGRAPRNMTAGFILKKEIPKKGAAAARQEAEDEA